MRRALRDWVEVAKGSPCPICGKPDWCMVKKDGTAAACARVSDGAARDRNGKLIEFADGQGYIHDLSRADTRIARHWKHVMSKPEPDPRPRQDWWARIMQWADALNSDQMRMHQISKAIGLDKLTLGGMWCGWNDTAKCYTFPMFDADAEPIGVRTRHADGTKRAVKGSKNGVFRMIRMAQARRYEPLLVCEGPTDAGSLFELGFDVVGRSHNTGNTEIITEIVRRDPRPVWIVSDFDAPGFMGAEKLADALCDTVAVKVIWPSVGKDAREWKKYGVIAHDIIDAASVQARWRITECA